MQVLRSEFLGDQAKFETTFKQKLDEVQTNLMSELKNTQANDQFKEMQNVYFKEQLEEARLETSDLILEMRKIEQNSQALIKNFKCDLSAIQIHEKQEKGMIQE